MDRENYEVLWEQELLPEIEGSVSSIAYESFIKTLTPVDLKGSTIVLCSESKLIAETVGKNIIGSKIREALAKSNSSVTDFLIVVAKDKEDYIKQMGEEEKEIFETQSSPINPRFTFDSFVVGQSNEFIYAAAKAVAENPGDTYNPLFIYGGTGLGKTHILMAIANYLKIHNPTLNVLYATCEQFTNQFIEGISKGKARTLALNLEEDIGTWTSCLLTTCNF